MRVFVTGASGWIGSAAAEESLAAGHDVVGLARSDESAAALTAKGAEVVRATLDDLDALQTAAAAADAVVHLAFKHDVAFSGDYQAAADADRLAIGAFGEALKGSGRPLLIASGTLGLAPGRVATEGDMPDVDSHPRIANAYAALALADSGVHPVVIRFAPTVHGAGDNGFVARLVDIARTTGVAGYLGDGGNRWPAVHRQDAGRLVRLAVEKAPARSVLHATAEDGVATRDIAAAIGRRLDLPVTAIPAERASEHFGFLADFFGLDVPASSTLTRELLGWEPTGPRLLDDLDAGRYTT